MEKRITQKTVDDLVCQFKNNGANWADKRVADIYRQGIMDLLEILPKPKVRYEGWVNIASIPEGEYVTNGLIFNTRDEALAHVNQDSAGYIDTVKIEWEV